MKYLLGIFTLSVLFFSCTNNNGTAQLSQQKEDSIRYDNLIMSVVMNDYNYLIPDYAREAELVRTDNNYYAYKINHVIGKGFKSDTTNGFTGSKEIYNKQLGLTLRIHRWTCGCEVSLPNTIISVSNQKDFEYAFIFYEEYLPRKDDSVIGHPRPQGPPTLEFQLNFITNALKINMLGQSNEAYHFFSLVTDSLLGLKKVTLKDTAALRMEKDAYVNEYINKEGCETCAQHISNEMNTMIAELKSGNKNIFYYHSSSKYYKGYWRFEFTSQEGRIYIKAHFNKCLCVEPQKA